MSVRKAALYFAFTLALTVYAAPDAFAQAASKPAGLTRNDVVLRPDKPTIYMCVDRELTRAKARESAGDLWLRIYNNTVWLIRFNAERMGTSAKVFRLSNGRNVPALTNESVAFPQFEFEPKAGKSGTPQSLWGDTSTSNWLPSDTHAAFKVPAKYFKDEKLYLEFNYEWELTSSHGTESYAPTHRVFFALADASDISGATCEP